MTQYVFGTGQLYSMPVGGGAPLRWGALQDVSVDFSGDTKMLYGQYQFALDVARGKAKVEWKASSANIDVNAFNQVYFGGTLVTGSELKQVFNESGTIPTTPFQITVVNAANFKMDLGVYFSTTGLPLKQVPSAPATGQYSVSAAGVYTFNTADTTKVVLINYMWESASTGASLTITNQLMGATPKFQMVLSQVYNAQTFTMVLYSNVADKLSLPLKQDDYLVAEISGASQANDLGQIGRITTTSLTGGGA